MNEKALCTARELAIGYGKTPLLSDICLGVQPGQILTSVSYTHLDVYTRQVLNHMLEVRAVIRFGGKGAVNVVLNYRNSVLFGISRTFTNLAFDGFFALVVAGIAGVNYGGHANTPFTSFSAGGAQGRMHCTAHGPPTQRCV